MFRLKGVQTVGDYSMPTYTVIDWTGSWQETDATTLPSNSFGTFSGCANMGIWAAMDSGDVDGDGLDEFVLAYWRDTDNDGVREAITDSVLIRVVNYNAGAWQAADVASYPVPARGRTGLRRRRCQQRFTGRDLCCW